MIYVDDPEQGGTGAGWLVGTGWSRLIPDWPTYLRLSLIHYDAGKLHPWKGIEWQDNHGAWDHANGQPRIAA